jgi:hypothetical protein
MECCFFERIEEGVHSYPNFSQGTSIEAVANIRAHDLALDQTRIFQNRDVPRYGSLPQREGSKIVRAHAIDAVGQNLEHRETGRV